jgi:hypothetical protein
MSSESERRDQDRETAGHHEARQEPRNAPGEWPRTTAAVDRRTSLRQRLADVGAPDTPAIGERRPEAAEAATQLKAPLALGAASTPYTAPMSSPARSSAAGLIVGFAASFVVGLLLIAWLKHEDLLALVNRQLVAAPETMHSVRRAPQRTERIAAAIADEPAPSRAAVVPLQSPVRSNVDVRAQCAALASEARPGILQVQISDRARGGSRILIKIDDLDYRGSFDADGRLLLMAPKLFAAATVRWPLADGTPCTQTVPFMRREAQLRVGLVWSGAPDLHLNIVEPNSWLGNITGHVSIHKPNLDHAHGAGEMHAFGGVGDPTRVELYVVELSRLGPAGVLTAVVETGSRAACTQAAQPPTLRYQVYTLRTDRVEGTPEVRSLAFELPPCGSAPAARPSERIAIRF